MRVSHMSEFSHIPGIGVVAQGWVQKATKNLFSSISAHVWSHRTGVPQGRFLCRRIGRIENADFRSTIYSTGCVWIPFFLSSGGSSFVLFLGLLIRGSRAGESQLKTASCPARGFYGVCLHSAACSAQGHVFVAPFPRAKCSFGARGVLIHFIVAVVALDFVESRQSKHSSSSSGVAKKVIDNTYR